MDQTKRMQLALREAARRYPDATAAELADETADILDEWREEAAHDREFFGEPEDTPTVSHCDLWGTGEGRYHGVIG